MDNSLQPINLKKTLQDAWRIQLPKIILTLLICLFLTIAAISVVYLISVVKNVPPSWLTRDPNELVPGKHSWVGALSKLGYMGWASAATLCFIGVALLARNRRFRSSMIFLLFSGLLTLVLSLDDTFMLHESVIPQLHISEKFVFGGYIILFIGYILYFFRRLLTTDYLILVFAAFFMGSSIAIDQLFAQTELKEFLEDIPKFMAILLWLAYYARTVFGLVKGSITLELAAQKESIQNPQPQKT